MSYSVLVREVRYTFTISVLQSIVFSHDAHLNIYSTRIYFYFIQFVKDLSSKVETVQKSTDDIKKKEEKQAQEKLDQPLDMNVEMLFPGAGP